MTIQNVFWGKPLFQETKQQLKDGLNGDQRKCTYPFPVVVCSVPEVFGRILARQ